MTYYAFDKMDMNRFAGSVQYPLDDDHFGTTEKVPSEGLTIWDGVNWIAERSV